MAELTKQREKEIAAELHEHPERDPLGFEAFLITESFDSLFSGLVGVYSRLAMKEERKAGGGDNTLAMKYRKRSDELFIIRNVAFRYDLKKMRDYTERYRSEYREALAMEKKYANNHAAKRALSAQ
ncbi:hypothetical protein [Parapedobacter sp. 10938]|uniref:hypothetical protein n=1 Tax=Parapedobacter flavus TaxID=3110225 RepID=UPI002DBCE5A1|nr:hypothetical protein [Parapedobacter sp. 10938]MEC3881989.1 hypothetical protein [Parapedobacter sp. 10938]